MKYISKLNNLFNVIKIAKNIKNEFYISFLDFQIALCAKKLIK